jgi:HSP20 family molecular chaperone IbpA
MSIYRALAPFRRAHFLRPRGPSSFTNLFDRDPFFAGIAPILNTELGQFQRYNFPRVDVKEGPKAYHLEAEIPGFRKDNLSIEFLDSRTLRISGKRGGIPATAGSDAVEPTEGDRADSELLTDDAAAKETIPTESAKNDEAATSVISRDTDSFDVVEAEEEFETMETERNQEVSFVRQWRLPEGVDQDAVKASLDHGILKVVLPKLKAEATRKVTIE